MSADRGAHGTDADGHIPEGRVGPRGVLLVLEQGVPQSLWKRPTEPGGGAKERGSEAKKPKIAHAWTGLWRKRHRVRGRPQLPLSQLKRYRDFLCVVPHPVPPTHQQRRPSSPSSASPPPWRPAPLRAEQRWAPPTAQSAARPPPTPPPGSPEDHFSRRCRRRRNHRARRRLARCGGPCGRRGRPPRRGAQRGRRSGARAPTCHGGRWGGSAIRGALYHRLLQCAKVAPRAHLVSVWHFFSSLSHQHARIWSLTPSLGGTGGPEASFARIAASLAVRPAYGSERSARMESQKGVREKRRVRAEHRVQSRVTAQRKQKQPRW